MFSGTSLLRIFSGRACLFFKNNAQQTFSDFILFFEKIGWVKYS